jgi:cell division protease FtsH
VLTPSARSRFIPRGIALGVTLSAPEADRFSYDRHYLLGKIKVALGGRVAEEIVYGEITTGAQNDIKQATELARSMVGLWGMSDVIGPVTVITEEGKLPIPGASDISPETQQLVDEEVRHMIEEQHEQVSELMSSNREKLDSLAEALLEHETLEQDEAYAAAGIELSDDPRAAGAALPVR